MGICTFCENVIISDLVDGLCPKCLKVYEPEDRPYDKAADEFTAEQEAELKVLMDAAVNKNADLHAVCKMPEPNPNLLEADMASRYREQDLTIAREARRSEALQMSYYILHKQGHFNTGKLPGATPQQQLLHDIEEVKEIARNNLKFILEG